MEDDWDLHAVVRGCSATNNAAAAAAPATTTSSTQLFSYRNQDCSFPANEGFREPFEPGGEKFSEELQALHKPFFPTLESARPVVSPRSFPISPLSVLGGLQDLLTEQQQSIVNQQPPQKHLPLSIWDVPKTKSSASHQASSRFKRRKNSSKRVCHVPVESLLSSDTWSWRKYGQKSIKGSPYPRSDPLPFMYLCPFCFSELSFRLVLKGCMARKQVERDRSDPGMFIVTHTGEHNHPMPTQRNSLAGSARQDQKQADPRYDDLGKLICSPEDTLSSAPAKLESSKEDREEDLVEAEDDDFRASNMKLDDDFFLGLDDLVFPAMEDCSSNHFPANPQFPWLGNHVTTTAAGGG